MRSGVSQLVVPAHDQWPEDCGSISFHFHNQLTRLTQIRASIFYIEWQHRHKSLRHLLQSYVHFYTAVCLEMYNYFVGDDW